VAKMAVVKRGLYNKPLRTQAMQEIRRLLVIEGYTYDEILQQLGLSKQTFYRYLSAIFSLTDT
jgi:DNA-binding CsgD family transcriptional regulator